MNRTEALKLVEALRQLLPASPAGRRALDPFYSRAKMTIREIYKDDPTPYLAELDVAYLNYQNAHEGRVLHVANKNTAVAQAVALLDTMAVQLELQAATSPAETRPEHTRAAGSSSQQSPKPVRSWKGVLRDFSPWFGLFSFLLGLAGAMIHPDPRMRIIAMAVALVSGLALGYNIGRWGLPLVLILGAVLGAFVFRLSSPPGTPLLPSLPTNEVRRIDFLHGIDETISIQGCDALPPTPQLDSWYHNCIDAPSDMSVVNDLYTGQGSLRTAIESSTVNARVYSLHVPITPPQFVTLVGVRINIPDHFLVDKVTLLVHVKGEPANWQFKDFQVAKDGWAQLFLDVSTLRAADGTPVSEKGIDELHIDTWLLPAYTKPQQINIGLDSIDFFYPYYYYP